MTQAVELLVLLILANGVPLVLYDLLQRRWAWPLDGGIRLPDGRRLLGPSVTARGVIGALGATTAAAPLLGQSAELGFIVGLGAMLGDASSSFLKRRLGMAPGAMAVGLDQIPESLLPLLMVRERCGLTWWEITALVLVFIAVELLGSRLLYRLHLRKTPY